MVDRTVPSDKEVKADAEKLASRRAWEKADRRIVRCHGLGMVKRYGSSLN